jgi:hypothetical protein
MSCGNLLNHGETVLHQSQKEFNSYDLGGGEFKLYLEIKRTNDHSEQLRADNHTDQTNSKGTV